MNRTPFHELDHWPTKNGCPGLMECTSCGKHLSDAVGQAVEAGKLEPGMGLHLPYHTLIMWPDGTFTAFPKILEKLN